MTIVYSVASRKGGVGKSSSSINLSSAFATMGLAGQNKRVLLIDLDPSGNATANCGINPETLSDKTTYQVVIGQQDIKDCIVHRDTFDLLPANSDLAASMTDFLIMYNQNGKQGEKILDKQIKSLGDEYDIIIEDNQPSWNKLLFASLISADMVLMPIEPAFFSVISLKEMIETINDVQENFDKILDYRIFLSKYSEQRVIDRESLNLVKEQVGEKLLQTKIRNNVSISEASGHFQSIFEYAPNSNGAHDYLSLAKEIISI